MIQSRRPIRLRGYDYSTNGAYFVTICAHNRICLFGNIANAEIILNDYGKTVGQAWFDLPNHYPEVELDASVIMPNHIHGIVVLHHDDVVGAGFKPALTPDNRRHGLSEIIRGFKSFSARRINAIRNTFGAPVWQRGYFDRVIRNEGELNRIREYVLNNSTNWDMDRENPDALMSQRRPQNKTAE